MVLIRCHHYLAVVVPWTSISFRDVWHRCVTGQRSGACGPMIGQDGSGWLQGTLRLSSRIGESQLIRVIAMEGKY